MPTIRIDQDVYDWLKSQAVPFEDTPNSVLRRLAEFDKNKDERDNSFEGEEKVRKMVTSTNLPRNKKLRGRYLKELWNVNIAHALYHIDGTWFENLREFPGGLFDYNGYVVFNTKHEYNTSPYLNIGQQLNVHDGISSIPGYKRMR